MGRDMDRLIGQVIASGALSRAERARRKEDAKMARRAERRTQRERDKMMALAEVWDDREGKARPTPERRLKGVFRLRDGDQAGVSVAADEAACVVDALAVAGKITARQREAGHGFEDAMRAAVGSPAGRSCIDFTPVGHEDDVDDAAVVAAQRRWASLRRVLRPADRRELEAVCWSRLAPVSMDRLRRGLDETGDWMGLEKER